MPFEKFEHGVTLPLTEKELTVLKALGEFQGTGVRNALRRGLKMYAAECGIEVPPEAFVDRKKGNWKENAKPRKKE